MIITRAPLRMSYVGGGSDLPEFYRHSTGAVVSAAINKYVYICVKERFESGIRLVYSSFEEVDAVKSIKHELIRECLLEIGISGSIEIASLADIPSHGTGLGSSSSFTVGLIKSLLHYKKRSMTATQVADLACKIEMDRCSQPIGKQDQYAAACGGLNLFEFHPNGEVTVVPINCSQRFIRRLDEYTLVFYTGRTRSASTILTRQRKAMEQLSSRRIVKEMVDLAYTLKGEIECERIDNVGEIISRNWDLKVQLADNIADEEITYMYNTGLANGASGGKLLGAGAGGFMMFIASPEHHGRISKALSRYRQVQFSIAQYGACVTDLSEDHRGMVND